jgi:cell division septation protein DedD
MDTFQEEVKAEMEATVLSKSNTQKKYYRVQLGAFSVKANADAMLRKVKAAGFNDAFIKYSE